MKRPAGRLLAAGVVASVGLASTVSAMGPATATPVATMTVSAGGTHTCALAATGAVRCWGDNAFGELGNGTHTTSRVPVPVRGLAGVRQISAGRSHTCALTTAGAVQCWGENDHGQLGNGTFTSSNIPVAVNGLAGVSAISSGWYATCALLKARTVLCWGDNDNGQLGNGAFADSDIPVAVKGLTGITAISAGGHHTCAMSAAVVRCWGRNVEGELGAGTLVTAPSSATPVVVQNPVQGGAAIAIASGGFHSCALLSSRGVRCWGEGVHGQLGQGHLQSSASPVSVKGASGITAITAGGYHTCELSKSHSVACWGLGTDGQTGYGDPFPADVPVGVQHLADPRAVTAGEFHTCAVRTNNTTVCWGRNTTGQLGNGAAKNAMTPVPVKGASSRPNPVNGCPGTFTTRPCERVWPARPGHPSFGVPTPALPDARSPSVEGYAGRTTRRAPRKHVSAAPVSVVSWFVACDSSALGDDSVRHPRRTVSTLVGGDNRADVGLAGGQARHDDRLRTGACNGRPCAATVVRHAGGGEARDG